MAAMMHYKQTGLLPKDELLTAWVLRHEANYECEEDGLLVRICWRDGEGKLPTIMQVVLPIPLRAAAVASAHSSPHGAHAKAWRTYHRLRQSYFWPQMRADVTRLLKLCGHCQLHGTAQRRAPLVGNLTADYPGQRWVADILKLHTSDLGYTMILVFVDVYSRWCELIPLRGNPGSAAMTTAFLNRIIPWGRDRKSVV